PEVPNPSVPDISNLPEMVDSLRIQPEVPNPSVPEISNPPETVDSLHKYETMPEQAQKFLDRVGLDFRWPQSMNDLDRGTAFFYIADDDTLEYDDEAGLNLICFFETLDKGTFNEHKDSWVLIYNQEVKRYGPEYTGKELNDLEHEMPGAIYLPIDKKQ
ncbi:5159_t:CDS:2, partial [Gigaspora margarita]